jgi:hypothetical protein
MTPYLAARLSEHVYGEIEPKVGPNVRFDLTDPTTGRSTTIQVVSVADNPRTGYQGAIYRDLQSGAFIVAHRGTEFGREARQDGLIADGGMVAARINAQLPDAMELTRSALAMARAEREKGTPAAVETTGHSLGGTHAQATAFRFQIPGHTFNAYGAIGINGIPDDARAPVVNHARVTDVVSAGNRHVGEVRLYARDQDFARSVNVPTLLTVAGPAHAIAEFSGPNSLLSDPQARQRAEHGAPMFDARRNEVALLRGGITLAAEAHLVQREARGQVAGAVLEGTGIAADATLRGAGRLQAGWTAAVTEAGALSVRAGTEVGALAQQGGARAVGGLVRVDGEIRAARDEALAGVARLAEWAVPAWRGIAQPYELRAERTREASRQLSEGLVRGADEGAAALRDGGREAANGLRRSGTAVADLQREAGERAGEAVRVPLQQGAAALRDATARPAGPMYREPEAGLPMSDRRHPQFALYEGAQRGIDALPSGRPDTAEGRERLAAALAGQAYMQGITRIEHVVVARDGERVFAVQGRLGDPAAHTAAVPASAERQPVAQSTQLVDDLREIRERSHAPAAAPAAPSMSR